MKLTADKIKKVKDSAPLKESSKTEKGKKKGRPFKAETEVKNKRIQSYYTDREYEKIIAAAKKEDISLAAFQRKILLKAIEESQGGQNDYTN